MENTPERFGPARGSAIFAGLLWAIVATSGIFLALGEGGAINPLIGCSAPALLMTYAAWTFYRQDRRHEESMRALRERLERERTS